MPSWRSGRHLVIAFFANREAAEVAALMLAEDGNFGAKSGTVGMLALDHAGRIAVAKLGSPTGDDGTGVGAVLGAIALALSGRVTPRRGDFFDRRSDLSTDDIARFGAELDAGLAAVAVLGERTEAEHVVIQLTELGGKAEVHHLTERALAQAASTATIAFS